MSKESAAPEKSTSRQIESAEGGESMGASMAPPAFQLMASESPIQRQETDAATATGTVQERYAAHSLTEEDLTDDYVIEQFAGLSIEQLFEYRRQATTEAVKVHILTLIDGRERDPYQSYLGKKFTINDPAAVIRDTNGTALVYAEGDTLPAGKKIGDQKIIPNGTEIYVTDIKDNLSYVYAEDWGWTGIDNIQGGMYNETLSIDRAEYDSVDPNHKTISTHDANIRTNTPTTLFPTVTPVAKLPKDAHVTVLERRSEDGGNVRVSYEGQEAWTRAGNISTTANEDGTFTVTDADARIRSLSVTYPTAGGVVAQGERVIVLQESQDTETPGKYVEVAYTKKNAAGTYERDTDRNPVWLSAGNFADNWADFKSDNARWAKSDTSGTLGQYLGQMDVVTLIGRDSSSGNQEVEKLSPELIAHYNTLRAAASGAGHDIRLNSGFRSFPEQQGLWDANPNSAEVARPGRSNHQNGIAIDINTGSFDSAMYLWMKDNAPALGWIRTVKKEHWHWEQRPADAAAYGHKMPGINP